MVAKKKKGKLILIISIIVVVLVLLLVIGKSVLTGNIIYRSYCSDNDGGQNFLLQGTVSVNTPEKQSYKNYTDYCRNSTQLIEYSCKSLTATSVNTNITNCAGSCLYGACLPKAPVNGVCGTTYNTCSNGTIFNISSNYTSYNWQCLGSGGGSNASCEATKLYNCQIINRSGIYVLQNDLYLNPGLICFRVNASNVHLSGNNKTIFGEYSPYFLIHFGIWFGKVNGSASNFNFVNVTVPIMVNTSYIHVFNNNINNCDYAISLDGGNRNTISNNKVSLRHGGCVALFIRDSYNNTIRNNDFTCNTKVNCFNSNNNYANNNSFNISSSTCPWMTTNRKACVNF